MEDDLECEGEDVDGVTGVTTEGAGGRRVSGLVETVPCRIFKKIKTDF